MITNKQNEFYKIISSRGRINFRPEYNFSEENYNSKTPEECLIKYCNVRGLESFGARYLISDLVNLLERELLNIKIYSNATGISIYVDPKNEFLQQHLEFEKNKNQREVSQQLINANEKMVDISERAFDISKRATETNERIADTNEKIANTNKWIKIGTIGTMIIGGLSFIAYLVFEIIKLASSN